MDYYVNVDAYAGLNNESPCPDGSTPPDFCFGSITQEASVYIRLAGWYGSEFFPEFENHYTRYPMKIEIDFSDDRIEAVSFTNGFNVVQEQWRKPNCRKTYIIQHNANDFDTGNIAASAVGGKHRGLLLVQDFDNAAYPYAGGFDPEEISDFSTLLTNFWIHLNGPWWRSLCQSDPSNCFTQGNLVAVVPFTITLTDGVGYKTTTTVYLNLLGSGGE